MFRQPGLAALALVAAALCAASAQEKGEPAKVDVELHLAAEHAPKGLKAGSRADLHLIRASTKTKSGKVSYSTQGVALDLEVVDVKREEKPKDPDRAVLVKLRATKAQAERIEKLKAMTVTVSERGPDGKPVLKRRPVPLRLELAPPAKP